MRYDRRHNYHDHSGSSPLEIGMLAEFDESLQNEPEHEKRRRRIHYLRDARGQVEAGRQLFGRMTNIHKGMMFIPCFWPLLPVLLMMGKMRDQASTMIDHQWRGALEYWRIDEEEVFRK